jgi:hypothetical protein
VDNELPVEERVSSLTGQTLYRVVGDDGCWYTSAKVARRDYLKILNHFRDGGHVSKKPKKH